jgi:hypothetical protein
MMTQLTWLERQVTGTECYLKSTRRTDPDGEHSYRLFLKPNARFLVKNELRPNEPDFFIGPDAHIPKQPFPEGNYIN